MQPWQARDDRELACSYSPFNTTGRCQGGWQRMVRSVAPGWSLQNIQSYDVEGSKCGRGKTSLDLASRPPRRGIVVTAIREVSMQRRQFLVRSAAVALSGPLLTFAAESPLTLALVNGSVWT